MSTKIVLARVDERLLHATVALNWNQFSNVNYIIVIDDSFIYDPFMEKVLQLSLPKYIDVRMYTIPKLLEFMEEETYDSRRVMIIFKNLKMAYQSIESGLNLKELQIPYPASRVMIKELKNYYSPLNIKYLEDIHNQGVDLYFQTTPMDTKMRIFK